jgi:hypothetical protein
MTSGKNDIRKANHRPYEEMSPPSSLGDQRRIAEADPIIVQHLYWFLFWK